MTTSISRQSSCRIHNIVEYIRNNRDLLCDIEELEECGIQNILQEHFDIFQTFSSQQIQNLRNELYGIALQNELREAGHLFHENSPYDEGMDLVHTNTNNIYGRRTTHRVFYSYPVDNNLRDMKKVKYPLKRATQKELRELAIIRKLMRHTMNEKHS